MVARVAHVASDAVSGPIGKAYERLAADGIAEPSANDVLCAAVTEAWFAGPVRRYATARAAAGASVHRYRIEHPSPDPDDLGALHSMSVPLLFGSWREGGVPRRLAGDSPQTASVTAAMQTDVRRFIYGEQLDWEPVPHSGPPQEVVYGGADGARTLRTADA
jgi:carboxylesterase type B